MPENGTTLEAQIAALPAMTVVEMRRFVRAEGLRITYLTQRPRAQLEAMIVDALRARAAA